MNLTIVTTQLTLLTLTVAAQQPPTPSDTLPPGLPHPNTTGFLSPKTHISHGGSAICVSGQIPIQASTISQTKFNFPIPQNQTTATQAFLSYTAANSTFLRDITQGTTTVGGSYSIQASLCFPANCSAPTTVEFLTHGVGFNRYYWDAAPDYSYVDAAARRGHATFFYDRLGTGNSSKPHPLDIVQVSLQVAIAQSLAQRLRNGDFGGIQPRKIVGFGHSFGSIITQAISANSSQIFDALVLTGFTTNTTAFPIFIQALNLEIAARNSPYRFSGLDPGYLAASSAISTQIAFLHFPGFIPIAALAANVFQGTVTYGELFTAGSVTKQAGNYSGPVMVVNGREDLPFCAGDCWDGGDKGAKTLSALYPRAGKGSRSYLVADTGHGINLHYSAKRTFEVVQDFLEGSGLGS